ncbi:hypothetical protein LTR08_008120 [Meristemomyces frigidus]|nr:hypothetical protein LTR08_008120 [Meristemomyces frigidus]
MSALYNLEPQPTAKLILHTTAGPLALELFAKQTPLASRSFLQHALDGYYTDTAFHRLVPGFVLQGGDPTGTGHGGASALEGGADFADEVHTRLKFNRRGLLGMAKDEAGGGGGGGNGSQFFLTLGPTPELQGVHTMFGRVEGETIYNLMKMGDGEVAEGTERPLFPAKITGAEVLVNPFPDMVARVKEAPRVREEVGKAQAKKRKKAAAGKNVLSFGGEEGEEEVLPVAKKAKANPKLFSLAQPQPESLRPTTEPAQPKPRQRRKERAPSVPPSDEDEGEDNPAQPPQQPPQQPPPNPADSEPDSPPAPRKSQSALDRMNLEIAALKASMKRTPALPPQEKARPKSALQAMIPATSTRGRKRGKVGDERGAIDLFRAFKGRLEDLPVVGRGEGEGVGREGLMAGGGDGGGVELAVRGEGVEVGDGDGDEEAQLCDLHFIAHCQSCASWDDNANGRADDDGLGTTANFAADDDDDAGGAWMSHTLSFAKDTLGKDLEWRRRMAEIEVVDPRAKARELGVEGGGSRSGNRGRGGGGAGRGSSVNGRGGWRGGMG